MDKNFIEMLEKLNTMLEKEIKNLEKNGDIKEKIHEAYEQPCEISIKKKGKTSEGADCKIVGSNLAILVTLAGLEKAILEKLNPPAGLYEMIKQTTGVMEAGDNE